MGLKGQIKMHHSAHPFIPEMSLQLAHHHSPRQQPEYWTGRKQLRGIFIAKAVGFKRLNLSTALLPQTLKWELLVPPLVQLRTLTQVRVRREWLFSFQYANKRYTVLRILEFNTYLENYPCPAKVVKAGYKKLV